MPLQIIDGILNHLKKESKVSDMVWNIFLQVDQWIVTF
ncbi:hypothetical protein BLGI_4993 [Brevibacillus laterosporus GI-9]|nr:hypothetical protein BLGI_4993 [Brevibacillus laterosporus GI-9]